MAVPVLITVSPVTGHTAGRSVVELKTNNLRLPPEPPPGYVNRPVQETVHVYFGGVRASRVDVISHARAVVITPPHAPGVVDVKVVNLDDNGDPIPGEEVTKVGAYTFQRPDLTQQSDLSLVTRSLVTAMRQQIIDNVTITTHTDYDDTPEDFLNIAAIAELPALVLVGPTVVENRFYSLNQPQTVYVAGGVEIHRVPYTVDLQFVVLGASELTRQLLDLMAAVMQFVNRTRYLEVPSDPDDPTSELVRYELDFTDSGGEPSVNTRLGEDNIRSFAGNIIIRGVDLTEEDMTQGLTEQAASVRLDVEQFAQAPTTPAPASPHGSLADADLPSAPDAGSFEIVIAEDEV